MRRHIIGIGVLFSCVFVFCTGFTAVLQAAVSNRDFNLTVPAGQTVTISDEGYALHSWIIVDGGALNVDNSYLTVLGGGAFYGSYNFIVINGGTASITNSTLEHYGNEILVGKELHNSSSQSTGSVNVSNSNVVAGFSVGEGSSAVFKGSSVGAISNSGNTYVYGGSVNGIHNTGYMYAGESATISISSYSGYENIGTLDVGNSTLSIIQGSRLENAGTLRLNGSTIDGYVVSGSNSSGHLLEGTRIEIGTEGVSITRSFLDIAAGTIALDISEFLELYYAGENSELSFHLSDFIDGRVQIRNRDYVSYEFFGFDESKYGITGFSSEHFYREDGIQDVLFSLRFNETTTTLVPEPATILLFGAAGLCGLPILNRKRRRS